MLRELTAVDSFAIFGGAPSFAAPLHVGRPNIGDRDKLMERINDMLDRRWLSNDGPFAQEFEQRIADMMGVKHCVAMCNATIALEIAIRAAGLTGEVLVPSYTFIATAHALQWQEITPVFCDVDPETHNIDPAQVEKMITPRTTGIIGVHVWGRPCDIDALADIADRHNLTLMFDAAHAFGCSYKGQMIGNFGDAEIFSFHATKFLNTFEGGAVCTNNDDLAVKMRLMKNFGFAGVDKVIYIGTNGKMSEVSAAMGLTGLESLDDFIAIHKRNYEVFQRELAGLPGVKVIRYDETQKNNYQYVVVEVDAERAGISRDQIVEILWAENVRARRYFYPGCHQMEPYRSYFPHAGLLLPNTEKLAQECMILPTGTAVDAEDAATISRLIRALVENAPEVTRRLADQSAPV